MARGDSPAISTRVWWAAFCIDGVENRGSRDEAEALKRLQAKQKPKHASDARFRRFVTSKARPTYGQGTL